MNLAPCFFIVRILSMQSVMGCKEDVTQCLIIVRPVLSSGSAA